MPTYDSTRYVVIDVETANDSRGSICQIGIASYEGGKLVETNQSLVNPEEDFLPSNIRIHGIKPKDVDGAPTYPQIAEQVRALLEDQYVVSYTLFDQDALRQVHTKYGIPFFATRWIDAHAVLKDYLSAHNVKGGFSQANMAKRFGVKYKSHDALEDARATGEIIQKVNELANTNIEDWLRDFRQPTLDVAPPVQMTRQVVTTSSNKNKRGGCVKWGAIVFSVLLVISVIGVLTSPGNDSGMDTAGKAPARIQATTRPTQTPKPTATEIPPTPTLSLDELFTIPSTGYEELARNTEQHVGETVCFSGVEVIQYLENGRSAQMRLQVADWLEPGNGVVFARYEGDRLLEGDQVDLCAKVRGRMSYESILGATITLPDLDVIALRISTGAEASHTESESVPVPTISVIQGTDNNGLQYSIEDGVGFETINIRSSADYFGDFELLGEVVNPSTGAPLGRYDVDIVITLYDTAGAIIEVRSTYLELEQIQPGQRSPFKSSLNIEMAQVGSYIVQFNLD